MLLLKGLFWGSLGAIAWTHAGYPLAAAALARVRPRAVRKADQTPRVTLIVPAHNEESVIARRLENLLALEYPVERLEIVVASDASVDRTDEIVEEFAAREPRVRLQRWPRGGTGSISATRRPDSAEPPCGHDPSFRPPAVKPGRRPVYEPDALAFEKPT